MTVAADRKIGNVIDENLELVKLHEFGLILNSTHNIDQIIKESAKLIREIFDGDGCHIVLARKIRDDLHLETAIHDGGKAFPPGVDATKGPIIGATFNTGEIIIVTDAENDSRVIKKIQQYFGHKSMVSVPITARGKIIGAVVIYSRHAAKYDLRDGEFLLMLSSHLGLAVENAYLMAQLHKASVTDPLTGAYNHGYFRDELAQIIKGQSDKLISLIMMDVNDLKVVNDTYGHTTGDYVLQEITELLKQNVRGQDTVARYGGDEFAIILPGTDTEEAMGVALRIEQAVSQHTFNRKETLEVAVSWGTITNRCQDITCIDKLIDTADSRLYNMKKLKNKPKNKTT